MLKRTDLKRTPMPPRSKPIERKPVPKRSKKRKAAIAANALNPALQEYFETHDRCFVSGLLGASTRDPRRRIVFHHIMGRFRTFDDPRNLCPLDDRIHRHLHNGGEFDDITGESLPELTPGMILGCKAEIEPELYDPEYLCWLRGWKSLPEIWEPCGLPAIYYLERERNGL